MNLAQTVEGDALGELTILSARNQAHEAPADSHLVPRNARPHAGVALYLNAAPSEEVDDIAKVGDHGLTAHAAVVCDVLETNDGVDDEHHLRHDGTLVYAVGMTFGGLDGGKQRRAIPLVGGDANTAARHALERAAVLARKGVHDIQLCAHGASRDGKMPCYLIRRGKGLATTEKLQALPLSSRQLDHIAPPSPYLARSAPHPQHKNGVLVPARN